MWDVIFARYGVFRIRYPEAMVPLQSLALCSPILRSEGPLHPSPSRSRTAEFPQPPPKVSNVILFEINCTYNPEAPVSTCLTSLPSPDDTSQGVLPKLAQLQEIQYENHKWREILCTSTRSLNIVGKSLNCSPALVCWKNEKATAIRKVPDWWNLK